MKTQIKMAGRFGEITAEGEIEEIQQNLPVLVEMASDLGSKASAWMPAMPSMPIEMNTSMEAPQAPIEINTEAETEFPDIDSSLGPSKGIQALLDTPWGRELPKSKSEIAEMLKLNGIHYPDSAIRSTLTQLTKANKIRRVPQSGKQGQRYAYLLR